VPTGGTTGQVLSKIDATNYNTQWSTPASGGALTDHTHAATGAGANGGGGTLTPATLNLPFTTTPAQTAEGQLVWDSGTDTITVGDSVGRKKFPYIASTAASSVGTGSSSGSNTNEAPRVDHVHGHELGHVLHDSAWAAKGDIVTGTGASTAVKTVVGADDTILMADAAATGGVKWVASATPSTQAFGDAAAVGTADTFTRGDHKHAMPAAPKQTRAGSTTFAAIAAGATANVVITIAAMPSVNYAVSMLQIQTAPRPIDTAVTVNSTTQFTLYATNTDSVSRTPSYAWLVVEY
jgi:hypothetical protein